MRAPTRRRMGALLALPLKVVWAALVVCTPILSVWVASSLATYLNGPVWAAFLVGLALFPGLPFSWDRMGEWRRARRLAKQKEERARKGLAREEPRRFLTFFDRFVLRTLAINATFLAVLLATHPQRGFEALATRGDWMLEGRHDATSEALRTRLFWGAEKLEWLYLAARDNPFAELAKKSDPSEDRIPDPQPPPAPQPPPGRSVPGEGPAEPDEPSGGEGSVPAPRGPRWPMAAELHPSVAAIPPGVETSYREVARHLAANVTDVTERAKALHDYVADRVAYDASSYVRGEYPRQDAETVFSSGKAVCAGYANLLAAMGKEAGLRIEVVVGDARTRGDELSGEGHAWNAVEIDGHWHLLDATWNAGFVSGDSFTKRYGTDYLFTPPEVFGVGHFPDEAKWQLREPALSRGDFLRQPVLKPRFYAAGLVLQRPKRSQVTVAGSVDIMIDNPNNLFMMASYGDQGFACDVSQGRQVSIHCEFTRNGRYQVQMFAAENDFASYPLVGQLAINSDR